jgi:tetratricopeptide (TPR) repeat protein
MKNEIIQALSENNPALALVKAKGLVEQDGVSAESHLLLGDAFMGMMEFKQAMKSYRTAKDIDPLNIVAYKKIGIAYAKLEKWESAVGSFRAALGLSPNDPTAKGLLGWSMWESTTNYSEQEACSLMREAIDNEVNFEPINNALADYHLDQAISTWPRLNDGNDTIMATKLEHLTMAKLEIGKAESYLRSNDNSTSKRKDDMKALVASSELRSFHGYPFVRRAPIIAAVVFLLLGNTSLSVFLLLLAGLYHLSQNKPDYLANRAYIKGDYGDPLWVTSVNSIVSFFSSLSVFGTSFTKVMLISLMFSVFSRILKYTLVIFILPWLILAGFYTNYDLFDRVKKIVLPD